MCYNWRTFATCESRVKEMSHSGRVRSLGKRVGVIASGVRIPPSPQNKKPDTNVSGDYVLREDGGIRTECRRSRCRPTGRRRTARVAADVLHILEAMPNKIC